MATFYQSDSIPEAQRSSLVVPRPVDTLMLVSGIIYYSTSATVAAYTEYCPQCAEIADTKSIDFDNGDVVFTSDSPNVRVSGTGALIYLDNFVQSYGTDADFSASYNSAGNSMNWTGANVAGNTAAFSVVTGNSAGGNSGNIVLTTGTAAGTRGVVDINAATIDLATQATTTLIPDNTSGAWILSEGGTTPYVFATTLNGNEVLGLSAVVPTVVQPLTRIGSPGNATEADGINSGTRWVVIESFAQRPQLAASIANTNASKTTEIVGTNAADLGAVFATGGGIALTTAAADNDQMVIRGNTVGADNSQAPLTGTNWSTNDEIRIRCNLRINNVSDTRWGAGFKLTVPTGGGAVPLDTGTDADQVWFGFSTTDNAFGTGANWAAVVSIANTDTPTDTGVVAAAGNIRLVIDVDSSRVCRFFINGALVHTTAALTAGVNFIPFAGLQAEAALASPTGTVQWMAVSKNFTP